MSWLHVRQLSADKDAAGLKASREFFLSLEEGKLRAVPFYALGLVVEPSGDKRDNAAIFLGRAEREIFGAVACLGYGERCFAFGAQLDMIDDSEFLFGIDDLDLYAAPCDVVDF
jgi:hypothetical protein